MNPVKKIELTVEEYTELKFYLKQNINELRNQPTNNNCFITELGSILDKLKNAEWEDNNE